MVAARNAWKEEQAQMKAENLVFFDESGHHLAMSFLMGWALSGKTPVIERPLKGTALSVLGAIGFNGPQAIKLHKGTVNGEVLLQYIREELGPTLRPGSIVIMDGPRLHRIEGIAEALAEFGATVRYLPAYSPELNPIEMTWAWCKAQVRALSPRHLALLKEKILECWGAITSQLCKSWFKHCGYQSSLST